jgi:RecA/RadA recombinase
MSKWMARLQKMEGAVDRSFNPFAEGIRTPSPSVNFTFGNTHLLPFGYSMVLYGPPGGGKSVLCNAMIGQLHRDYPEAVAIKFNTEMREEGQLTDVEASKWGIDPERYMAFNVNSPDLIFDRITSEFKDWVEKEKFPLKLIIIDSVSCIQGRRAIDNDSVLDQTIGDLAMTLQIGLQRILQFQRKHRIAVILTAHVRAEMDADKAKWGSGGAGGGFGKKVRMAASFATQHYAEYFLYIEPDHTKLGGTKEAEAEGHKDLAGQVDQTAHKIRVVMKKSSVGAPGRVGRFTLDYKRGIIDVEEEVFQLAKARGVLDASGAWYSFNGTKWNGEAATSARSRPTRTSATRCSPRSRRDLAGEFKQTEEERENAGSIPE